MNKIVLGIVGEISSGKTTLTDYIKKTHKISSWRFSDILRDVLKKINIEETRSNMQNLSTMFRQTFGENLLSKVLAENISKSSDNFIIVEGIRRPSDISYLKNIDGFHIIAIDVNEKNRFKRLIERSENPDDQNKTWEKFQEEGAQESEEQIKVVMKTADFILNNNESLKDLHRQIDELIIKLNN